jgi:MraZ protein
VFLGEYEHSVDAKGRLAIPAKFRPQLDAGLVVTRGFERCLQVYPMAAWRILSERVSALSLGQPEARQLRRLLFSTAFDTEVDKQGRILIPVGLRDYAGIVENAVVTGMNTYLEIWATDAWEETLASLADDGHSIAETMANLGI